MEGTRRLLVALLTVTLLAPLAPLGSAWHKEMGVFMEGTTPGQGWTAVKLSSQGKTISATVRGCDFDWVHWVEVRLYDADGTLLRRSTGSGNEYREGILVEVDSDEFAIHYDSTASTRTGSHCHNARLEVSGLFGVHTLVLIAAGDFDYWTHEILGGFGTEILAVEQDDTAFHYASKDFRGIATVQAWPSLGAHAAAAGEIPMKVTGTLIGFFSSASGGDVMTATGPFGTVACPCTFDEDPALALDTYAAPGAWGPGNYTFSLSGAGAGADFMDVRLVGADVRFP